jgi:hypothetical protein
MRSDIVPGGPFPDYERRKAWHAGDCSKFYGWSKRAATTIGAGGP